MSSFLQTLSDKLQNSNETEANEFVLDSFNHSRQPYDDLFEYLSTLTNTRHNENRSISCLFQSFLQWKEQPSNRNFRVPLYDQNLIDEFILKTLPIQFLLDFSQIFQISKSYLLSLLRDIFHNSNISTPIYKRALNIVVKFEFQFDFYPNDILLPLIFDNKDQLIYTYMDNNRPLEEYFLDILNRLYDNGGKRMRDILANEYRMQNVNVNRKILGKLAVRFWNSIGQNQTARYPNLASLQQRRALGYLISVKYNGNTEEKSMSDEAWNEIVEVRRPDRMRRILMVRIFLPRKLYSRIIMTYPSIYTSY